MIGTITNVCCIVAGSLAGSVLRKGVSDRQQTALFDAMGLASLGLGFNAICQNMSQSRFPVLFIVSLALGSLVGTVLDLDGRCRSLFPSGSSGSLAEGVTTAVLLFCIGTLSILGPINSALTGDNTYLFTNSTLDLVSSTVLATTYGPGIMLAAPVLFVWQGSFYLVATLFGDVISDALRCELSLVGGALIVASGLSILKVKDCKTINMLPALVVPVVFFLLKGLWGWR